MPAFCKHRHTAYERSEDTLAVTWQYATETWPDPVLEYGEAWERYIYHSQTERTTDSKGAYHD